ncbi:MAG TPA: shikimate dehydrogenase [Lachnospiraceae bacterium]|nr:shikimate dehydrogenase [Lachnospiraceae bacterium]
MRIDGNTKTCVLLGDPVEHTLSPVIHSALAEFTGINMVYVPCRVKAEDMESAIKGAFALNILGLNVTIPHKEQAIPLLCETDKLAEKIGAVNTLVRMNDGYKGFNTDMPGLCRAMKSDGIRIQDENVIVFGAGGVARAVVVMLCDKANHIYIVNRTIKRAKEIANEVNAYVGRRVAEAICLDEYVLIPDGRYLAIQATNVGMYPHCEEAVVNDLQFIKKIHTCYDLIYNPEKTRFMQLVEKAGGKAYNGLKMLLYQGIIAFELWNDVAITDEQANLVYERLRKSL